MTEFGKVPGDFIVIRNAIAGGAMDECLDQLEQRIKQRKMVLASKRAAELEIGDEFYLVMNIKPQLLAGARCRVKGFLGTKVQVELLENRSQKWRKGGSVRVPRTLIGEPAE